MTKTQLKTIEHVTYRETKDFVHLHCEEGFILTDWNKEDVKEYNGSDCYYLPIRASYPDYYIITQDEHNKLEEAKEAAFEAEFNKEDSNE